MISYYMWSTAGKQHHFWKSDNTFPAYPAYVSLHQILVQIFTRSFQELSLFFRSFLSLHFFLNLKEVQSMSKGKQIR